ncbi:MAG: RloB family protein [Sphaerochaetaceae bacterium]
MRKTKQLKGERTILIVSEGSVEKLYFDSLKEKIRAPGLSIIPKEAKHSSLGCIIETAIDAIKSGVYDSVWLVYDRDTQARVSKTVLARLETAKRNKNLRVADSFPAFEVWFLAHYRLPKVLYFDQDGVIEDLMHFIPDYSKETDWHKRHFLIDSLLPRLQTALANCRKLDVQAGSDAEKTVSRIWQLIEDIQEKSV